MLRSPVIKAVFWRNLASYFSGVLGYLFIVVFVVSCAAAAFGPRFFTNNLATLDQLSEYFPLLLLFIVPAVTMTSWAEEKRSGTDELLFTLPASDLEVLLGKYFAVFAVYTVALAFSGFNLFVLEFYADPDWGLLCTTYFGYWLAGGALLAAGMFASVLTSSITVAFVLGVLVCVVPVFGDRLAYFAAASVQYAAILGILLLLIAFLMQMLLSNPSRVTITSLFGLGGFFIVCSGVWFLVTRWAGKDVDFHLSQFAPFSLSEQTRDFSLGIVSLNSLAYFVTLTGFLLYLNSVFIGKRHWSGGPYGATMGSQFVVRTVALVVILISANVLVARLSEVPLPIPTALDMTSEKLFTLSKTTTNVIKQIDNNRPVTIQAFISPEVPRDQVMIQKRLKGLLRQYDREGGSRLEVRFVDVTPFSEQAEEARLLGIQPIQVMTDEDGRRGTQQIHMGVVVTSPTDEVVVPLFEAGTSVEYELTRSIRTVATENRKMLGILRTDAKVSGGFDMASFRSAPEWRVMTELKKQYKVEEVTPDTPIDGKKYDVLLAVMPSTLTANQLPNLVEYIKSGKPVLVFDDPLPLMIDGSGGGALAPRQGKPKPGGMFGGMNQPPEQKAEQGKLTSLLRVLEISWDNGEVVLDVTGPSLHPEFAQIPPEYVFVTEKKDFKNAFHQDSDVTKGLQEVLAIYPGHIKQRKESQLKFDALLRTTPKKSGYHEWEKLVSPGGMFGEGIQLNPNARPVITADNYTLAAHVTGKADKDAKPINVIFVADADMISSQVLNFEFQAVSNTLRLDNVKFVLNCVDVLAGDAAFNDLRTRRAQLRTLTRMQDITEQFRKDQAEQRNNAESEAADQLKKAQERLDKVVAEIKNDTTLSAIEKQQRIKIAQETEQKKLAAASVTIERERSAQIEKINAKTQQKVRATEDRMRWWSILLPPIPAVLLGVIVLSMRINAEYRNIETDRLVKT